MSASGRLAAPARAGVRTGNSAGLSAGALYAVYAFVVCALFWPTLGEMATAWLSSSSYHHGFLVAPIALFLISRSGAATAIGDRGWRAGAIASGDQSGSPDAIDFLVVAPVARKTGFHFFARRSSGLGAAAALWLIGRAAGVNLIEQIGFVSLLIAGCVVIFGAPRARQWAFPLAFLYFMVPFGGAALPALQSFAAHGVVLLLRFSGVETSLDGVMITTSFGPFLIAEACAGLNFLLAATMIAAAYASMAFQGWRKCAIFVALAALFALLANILRAYVVIIFETLTAGRYSVAENHVLFGWVFYSILIFLLIAVGRRFADISIHRSDPAPIRANAPSSAAMMAALAVLAATSTYGRFVIDRAPDYLLPTTLPFINAPGWRVSAPSPDWRASIERADRMLFAGYRADDAHILTASAYFAYDRRGAEIAGSATRAYDGRDWRRIGSHHIALSAFGAPKNIRIEILQNPAGERLAAATLYWLGEKIFVDPAALKIHQAALRLRGRNGRGGVFIVAAPAPDGADADGAIRAFLESVEPLETWLARIDAKLSN